MNLLKQKRPSFENNVMILKLLLLTQLSRLETIRKKQSMTVLLPDKP